MGYTCPSMPRPGLTTTVAAVAFTSFASFAPPASAQWDPRAPSATPAGRVNAGMTFDPASGALILFGGSTTTPAPSNQTWRYDGNAWTLLSPPNTPGGRFGIELVADLARNVCVLYGGWTSAIAIGTASNQTWEWNGTTWAQAYPANNPGPRCNYSLAFDAVRNKTVLFGGSDSLAFPIAQNDTWEYDGVNWTPMLQVGSPGPLERAAMAFHSGTGTTVLFGGSDSLGGGTDTTWLYDGTAWTAANVPGARPAPRTGASMTYDPVRDVCVLTCGMHPLTGMRFDDTWEWDGSAWSLQPTTTAGVLDACFAFLPTTRQAVKFGGLTSMLPFVLNGETWEFGAKHGTFGNGCAGVAGVPALAAVDAPRLGQSFRVDLTNLDPTVGIGILFFGFTQLPGADLTFVGMPGCALFTSPDVVVSMTGAGGTATWTWPAVAGLIGDTFYGQAMGLDPSLNTLGYSISNAISARIGN
jgi:hypothetical protein